MNTRQKKRKLAQRQAHAEKRDNHFEARQENTLKWKNGSKMEVLPGSVPATSAPRDPVVTHRDEVELMPPDLLTTAPRKQDGLLSKVFKR